MGFGKQKLFDLSLGDSAFEEAVKSIKLSSALDTASKLTVEFSLPPKELETMGIQSIPVSAKFSCQGRGLFSGDLIRASVKSRSVVELVYCDRLLLTDRQYESEYLKQQRLEDAIQMIASSVGLTPRFAGSFQDMLAGMDITGKSFLQILGELSQQFGFHFSCRSYVKELLCLKLGQFKDEVSVDLMDDSVLDASTFSGSDRFYSSAEMRFFDTHKGDSEKREVSQSSIYESLGKLKSHASFSDRLNWSTAMGRMESVATDGTQFSSGEREIQSQLSKLASAQEGVRLRSSAPFGLPGDKLEIANAPTSAAQGSYLLNDLRVSIRGAAAMCETGGVRA